MEFPYRAFWCACGGRYAPPPHAWGIRPGAEAKAAAARFIPTCVGNTRGLPLGQPLQLGSSPRAWGIPKKTIKKKNVFRFIPTCVGNTVLVQHKTCGVAVHPHMRGEYSLVFLISSVIFGSSPHAWGIRTTIGSRDEHERFIPTCVGNTQAQHLAGTHQPVHPHVRGEYSRKHEEFSKVIIAAKIYRSGTA